YFEKNPAWQVYTLQRTSRIPNRHPLADVLADIKSQWHRLTPYGGFFNWKRDRGLVVLLLVLFAVAGALICLGVWNRNNNRPAPTHPPSTAGGNNRPPPTPPVPEKPAWPRMMAGPCPTRSGCPPTGRKSPSPKMPTGNLNKRTRFYGSSWPTKRPIWTASP